MLIFAVGDVVGTSGCKCLLAHLSSFKRLKGVDVCIVNGENSAQGNGMTPDSCESLLLAGADLVTSGNHVYKRREVYEYLDSKKPVMRPYNYNKNNPGKGVYIIDKGRYRVGVINLAGTVYCEAADNPFYSADAALAEIEDCKIKLVDFHAEATAEKRAMGFYLDGRVTAVFGTHTHVQTADEQLLPAGTAYITDLGMTGPEASVLGVEPSVIINKFKYNMPARFDAADGACSINGMLIEADEKTGHALSVERIILK